MHTQRALACPLTRSFAHHSHFISTVAFFLSVASFRACLNLNELDVCKMLCKSVHRTTTSNKRATQKMEERVKSTPLYFFVSLFFGCVVFVRARAYMGHQWWNGWNASFIPATLPHTIHRGGKEKSSHSEDIVIVEMIKWKWKQTTKCILYPNPYRKFHDIKIHFIFYMLHFNLTMDGVLSFIYLFTSRLLRPKWNAEKKKQETIAGGGEKMCRGRVIFLRYPSRRNVNSDYTHDFKWKSWNVLLEK